LTTIGTNGCSDCFDLVHATGGNDNFRSGISQSTRDAFTNSTSAASNNGNVAFEAEEFTWCGVFLAHFLSILLGVD
jgi:hypothetical protein